MVPKSSPGSSVCQRCGAGRALVLITSDLRREAVCGQCIPAGLNARTPAGALAAELVIALLGEDSGSENPGRPLPERCGPCAECGLTYAEFAAGGRAGCPACYEAFLPVVRHGVAVLHSPSGMGPA
jgi:protein-arginine kinase activator protein McsA